MSSILLTPGRIAFLGAIKTKDLYLAWGTGNPSWDTNGTPVIDGGATALLAEVGRRKIINKQFVVPDDNGSIIVDGQAYSLSASPTEYLYLTVTFDPADAPSAHIRELGVFQEVQVQAGLSDGQMYFLPNQVVLPGVMLLGQNRAAILRNSTAHENFSFVLSL